MICSLSKPSVLKGEIKSCFCKLIWLYQTEWYCHYSQYYYTCASTGKRSFVLCICCQKTGHFAGEIGLGFESFGSNSFISLGYFVSSAPKGNRSKWRFNLNPTRIPHCLWLGLVLQFHLMVRSNFLKCILSLAATCMCWLKLIFRRHMQNPPVERASSKIMEICCLQIVLVIGKGQRIGTWVCPWWELI